MNDGRGFLSGGEPATAQDTAATQKLLSVSSEEHVFQKTGAAQTRQSGRVDADFGGNT